MRVLYIFEDGAMRQADIEKLNEDDIESIVAGILDVIVLDDNLGFCQHDSNGKRIVILSL